MSVSCRRPHRGWPAPRRLRAPLAGALLLHGAALAWLWAAWQAHDAGSTARQSLAVRWFDAERPSDRDSGTVDRHNMPVESARKEAPVPQREFVSPPEAGSIAAPAVTAPGKPESAAPSARTRIDPDSIARAARETARTPSWARQSDELIGRTASPSAQQKLAADAAAAAKPDCLKGGEGGYGRQGLGLFAIPFLIADAAAGRCRD